MQKVVVPPTRLKTNIKSPTTYPATASPTKKSSCISLSNKCCIHEHNQPHEKQKEGNASEKIFSSKTCCEDLFKDNAPPAVAITLTSPEGINKSLLKPNGSYRKSSRIKVKGIPTSKSDFWLPPVANVPFKIPEKSNLNQDEKQDFKDLDKYQTKPTVEISKCDKSEMFEAMKLHEFQFVENARDVLHACKTKDDKWLAVSKNSILCFRERTSSFCCVSIQDVASVWVDTDYLLISFELFPESELGCIEAIPGEADKTESLISSVMFASSRHFNKRTRLPATPPELRIKTVAEFPVCTTIMKENYCGEKVLFSAVAYFETIQSHSKVSNEFELITKGQLDLSQPVDLTLMYGGKILEIQLSCLTDQENSVAEHNENENQINLDEYAISKSEEGRFHIITLHKKSTESSIQLAATNESAFQEWMWRLQTVKDCPENVPRQLIYVIVTENCLCMFSALKAKKLLLRALHLNLASIGQADDFSCLITVDGEEMDEITSGKTVWRKISFLTASQCSRFYKILKSKVESNYSTPDF